MSAGLVHLRQLRDFPKGRLADQDEIEQAVVRSGGRRGAEAAAVIAAVAGDRHQENIPVAADAVDDDLQVFPDFPEKRPDHRQIVGDRAAQKRYPFYPAHQHRDARIHADRAEVHGNAAVRADGVDRARAGRKLLFRRKKILFPAERLDIVVPGPAGESADLGVLPANRPRGDFTQRPVAADAVNAHGAFPPGLVGGKFGRLAGELRHMAGIGEAARFHIGADPREKRQIRILFARNRVDDE